MNMTVSNFIKNSELKSLLIAYFNLCNETEEYFEIISSYKKSKFSTIDLTDDLRNENNKLLNNWSMLKFELSESKHIFRIFKDENCKTLEEFIFILYKEIQKNIIEMDSDELSAIILLSLFSLRGSADFKLNLYSVDVPKICAKKFYYEKTLKLLMNVDLTKFNLNFRELQQDYLNNKKRNTQIRVQLSWFVKKTLSDLQNINKYKADILETNMDKLKPAKNSFDFIERTAFYMANFFDNNNLNKNDNFELEIKKLRAELKFDANDEKENAIITRSRAIVDFAKLTYKDECVSCKDIYDINDRSFKYRNGSGYYLEIHHVISFASDKNGDQLDNLVKLCPICHRALTKNRAEEDFQKEIILRILKNSNNAYDYVESFFNNKTNIENMVDYVYDRLK